MADPQRSTRGLLDTSVVIELERLDAASLPDELAVSTITLAELAAGPHAATDVALSSEIPLYTLNPDDFAGLAELLEIVSPVP